MNCRGPSYPTTTDRAVASQLAHLNAIAEEQGLDAARTEMVMQLVASALWADRTYGTCAAYGLIQMLADELIASELTCDDAS
jgi:hypothetical protein